MSFEIQEIYKHLQSSHLTSFTSSLQWVGVEAPATIYEGWKQRKKRRKRLPGSHMLHFVSWSVSYDYLLFVLCVLVPLFLFSKCFLVLFLFSSFSLYPVCPSVTLTHCHTPTAKLPSIISSGLAFYYLPLLLVCLIFTILIGSSLLWVFHSWVFWTIYSLSSSFWAPMNSFSASESLDLSSFSSFTSSCLWWCPRCAQSDSGLGNGRASP